MQIVAATFFFNARLSALSSDFYYLAVYTVFHNYRTPSITVIKL